MAESFDHSTLVDFLRNPASYPHPVDTVEEEQTHISWVFLTGNLVYKLKKPVNFGFLDFSTVELRKEFCEAEVELNRRLAPDVYLRVEPITVDGGKPTIGGAGPAIDWLVVMRQLDRSRLGLAVLERGELCAAQINAVVDRLTPFYEVAATGPGINEYGKAEAFKINTDENFDQTRDWVGKALSARRFEEIQAYTNGFFESEGLLFERRIAADKIRECHGDLHLRNIFFESDPVIFDCIEFNQRFRCSDVAADLAFLAMDLQFRGRPDLKHRLIDRYIERSGDEDFLKLIDFYCCYRAYVRGKIACFTAADPGLQAEDQQRQLDLARKYFALAHRFTGNTEKPLVVVVFGLMGSGKTSLAGFLEERYSWTVIRSDAVRKQLGGIEETTRVYVPYDHGLYSPEMNRRTFDTMYEIASDHLRAGQSVVMDGSFRTHDERARAASITENAGAEIVFLHTTCSESEQVRRLRKREKTDPNGSDGRFELAEKQRRDFEEPVPDDYQNFFGVTTDPPKDKVRERLGAQLDDIGRRGK